MTVLAYTSSGDGVRSSPVYCQTEEDVPSAPAQIKAVLSAPNKILVSWLPPVHSNGPLTGYTFYMSVVEDGQEEGNPQEGAEPFHRDARGPARPRNRHAAVLGHRVHQIRFAIKALKTISKIGEGESTRVITVTPSKNVPAKIASFGREVISAWKQDIYLHCRRVGVPLPNAVWRHNDLPLEVGGRRSILPNATLAIKVGKGTKYQNIDIFSENNR
ncbi:hypothetical protein NQ318_003983 [Aromia moschata]|uniref:Uncharacterized protein n=1 Tax=Aromia moschata TaxID=1265417 RepID=A0AAV8Z7P9_9CUCU|nr:hypothetical protein NQ318_003983 [Aromia moschata]